MFEPLKPQTLESSFLELFGDAPIQLYRVLRGSPPPAPEFDYVDMRVRIVRDTIDGMPIGSNE